jgi:tetratricopeptide (TPR) repeat protein
VTAPRRAGSVRALGLLVLLPAVLLGAAGCSRRGALSPAEKLEKSGNDAYAAGEYEQAATSYQSALDAGARKPLLSNNLGNALFREGKYGAAQAAYLRALGLDPEYLFATNNLVLALYRNGERDRAWQLLRQAQMGWPRASFFYTTAGYLRSLEGDRAGAAKAFQEAIRLNPDSPAALNNVGVILMEDPSSTEDPLPYLMRAIEKDPENMLFRDSLGWYYFTRGMFAEATIEIGKAFLYDPKNLDVRTHYATVLEWIGKEKEALEQWQKILELADDDRVKRVAHEHYWDLQGRGVTRPPG